MALEQREKRLLMVPVALGAIIAFYTYVHQPLFARRAEAAELSQNVAMELQKGQSRLKKEGNLTVRAEAVAAREQVVDAWVPGKNSATMFIWYLSQAELQSGVRVKGVSVGERSIVKVQPNGAAQAGAPENSGTQAPSGSGEFSLAVIGLDLKLSGRFAQHLLFNQALEEMPLFLNADTLALTRAGDIPVDQAGKWIEKGNTWMAAQVLSASPKLDGSYQINLYFKADKAGPTTEDMSFADAPGRTDPFAMTGVDEFLEALVQYYAAQKAEQGSGGSSGNGGADCKCHGPGPVQPPVVPGKEQMG